VLIAPPGQHAVVPARGRLLLRPGAASKDVHIPSGTLLLDSVAKAYGTRAVGIILTGMGNDGADGLLAIKNAGGHTMAQSEESCVVFGMPEAAIAKKAVQQIINGDDLAQEILKLVRGEPPRGR
jgi:two-component system chemotaxis response regulator CheB